MPFIGVMAKESDCNFIKNEVLKNSEKRKFEFINITKQSIENIKNIRFETLVIDTDLSDFLKSSKYLEDLIKNAKYLIINSDIIKNTEIIINSKKNIITYGLNQKATVTLSSIETENILICVQNKFKNLDGKKVEEQEVKIEISKNNMKKICNSMIIFTILTIYGEKLKKI